MKFSQLLFVSFAVTMILVISSLGQKQQVFQANFEKPIVVTAVAPTFIPWMFEKTGVGQTVVEVRINPVGKVTSAKSVEGSPDFPWADHSFEQTAMRWHFVPTDKIQERIVKITFVLRIMPRNTREDELAAVYSAPYQIEVRHKVFELPITIAPLPVKASLGKKRRS